jgi:hypothetical protein
MEELKKLQYLSLVSKITNGERVINRPHACRGAWPQLAGQAVHRAA